MLADDEFYDAVESGLDKMEEEQELREKLKTGQIPITPPPTSPALQHRLWPEVCLKNRLLLYITVFLIISD